MQLWFAMRYVHVASITLLAGGALLLMTCAVRSSAPEMRTFAAVAAAYEWIFWAAAGITVASGVSNLGLKGEGLLGAKTGWGTALSIKLALVLTLFVLSLVRSELVMLFTQLPQFSDPARITRPLAILYGLTTAAIFGAAWIGLGLAHGRY